MGRAQWSARRIAAVVGSLTLAAWVAWWGLHKSSPPTPVAGLSASGPAASAAYSLRGTTPDGAVQATADDALVLNPQLIRLFEYYLSTVGERPLADIRAQIERDLDGRLGPNAARQAKDVLGRYLGYKQAMKAATAEGLAKTATSEELARSAMRAASGPAVDRLRTALQSMQATRALYFSAAESLALFGPDDATAQAALDRLAAEHDPAASPEERRARLAALDKADPAATQAREASNAVNRLNEETQRILAGGGTQDDVYRMRAATVSPEAANRLADLDRDEALWKSRIDDYLQQRSGSLAGPDADGNVSRLRARLFSPEEQRRLPAYER